MIEQMCCIKIKLTASKFLTQWGIKSSSVKSIQIIELHGVLIHIPGRTDWLPCVYVSSLVCLLRCLCEFN